MQARMVHRLLWVAALAVALPAAARAAGGHACTGTFALPVAPVLPAYTGAQARVTAVQIAAGKVTLVGLCPARLARVARMRRGWRVAVKWARCGEYRRIRLAARIFDQCSTLRATLRTKRPSLHVSINGNLSTCGDGRVDPGAGEECDPPGGARCDRQCLSIPSTCGNGRVDVGEECDDGNASDDDACSLSCHLNVTCDEVRFASTWAAVQSVVFEKRGCTAVACHGSATPTGGLDLRPANAYAALVGVPSQRDPSVKRIAVGDPDRSLLYLKVAPGLDTGRYGSPMPLQQTPLSPDELDALKLWIRAGAPDEGVVSGTASELRTCLPGSTPAKIAPLPPPPVGQGVQLYGPPWTIAPHGEDEVCFATTYDFSNRVPPERLIDCPPDWGGAARKCFAYTGSQFRQDPNSHHSIIYAYTGTASFDAFGSFTCHGGAQAGQPCDPTKPGVAAPAGADCGGRSACAGTIAHLAPGCYPVAGGSFGPADFSTGGGVSNTPTTHGIGGAQTPVASSSYPAGVYAVLPVKGVIVWNSHAFNLTTEPTTNEQWLNLEFGTGQLQHLVLPVFDATGIYDTRVPPFAQEEICRTSTFERGARIIELSSRTHKRGVRFRVWGPPIDPCGDCQPESGTPLFTTTDYADPAKVRYEPPLPLDSPSAAQRTFKFCALYDNGYTNPATVKRKSKAPILSLGFCNGVAHYGLDCCADLRCIGGLAGKACSNDGDCGGIPGACDACTLYGGVTTEDEMFILTGSYYQISPP
jgi:cysteine-rich repeat protein